MASYEGISNLLDFAVAFNPSTAFPLDARSMFGSYTAAQAAAATAENAGSSNMVCPSLSLRMTLLPCTSFRVIKP